MLRVLQPADPTWPRYSARPFPAYRYVPGLTPHPRRDASGHSFGAPQPGAWHAIVNTDAAQYGGTSPERLPPFHTSDEPSHGHPWSMVMKLPPLSTMILQRRG